MDFKVIGQSLIIFGAGWGGCYLYSKHLEKKAITNPGDAAAAEIENRLALMSEDKYPFDNNVFNDPNLNSPVRFRY